MKVILRDFRDNVRTRPFQFVICVVSLLYIWSIVHILIEDPGRLSNIESGFLSLPKPVLWCWCCIGSIGSILMVIAFTANVFSEKGHAIEASGLWLSGSMWLSAAVSALIFFPSDWTEYSQYLVITIGFVTRLSVLRQFRHVRSKAEGIM